MNVVICFSLYEFYWENVAIARVNLTGFFLMSVLALYAAIFSLINLLQNDDSTKEERPSKRVRSDVDIDPLMSAVLPDPSSFSDPKIWKGHQLESPLLLNHRPSTANGVPIALSHPIFARFQELCNSCEVNQEECDFVLNLTSAMSDPFKDEDNRREKFVEIVEQYFCRTCERTFFGKTHTDGCIMMRKGLLRIPLAILLYRNL